MAQTFKNISINNYMELTNNQIIKSTSKNYLMKQSNIINQTIKQSNN
jgi:hypothetical protein